MSGSYWKQVVERGFGVPSDRPLDDLTAELTRMLGSTDPVLRDELAGSYIGLQVMKYNGMRMLTNLVHKGQLGPEASIGKLFWTTWHKGFGETAMRVLDADALCVAEADGGEYKLDEHEQIFMASRAETIYAGSSEIQRNIIGERVLGLPREPK